MYSLCPQEGAFYLCKITIDKGNNMDIRFGYDTRYEELKRHLAIVILAKISVNIHGRKSSFLIGWRIY